jgi:YHS domain-containing protein
MKKILMMMTATVLIVGSAQAGEGHDSRATHNEDAKITTQTICPVMGGKVNKDLYVDHDGKRIYVCCKGCIDAVRKAPEKYIKKLAEKGEVPAAIPKTAKENKAAHDAHNGHEGHQH